MWSWENSPAGHRVGLCQPLVWVSWHVLETTRRKLRGPELGRVIFQRVTILDTTSPAHWYWWMGYQWSIFENYSLKGFISLSVSSNISPPPPFFFSDKPQWASLNFISPYSATARRKIRNSNHMGLKTTFLASLCLVYGTLFPSLLLLLPHLRAAPGCS